MLCDVSLSARMAVPDYRREHGREHDRELGREYGLMRFSREAVRMIGSGNIRDPRRSVAEPNAWSDSCR